MSANLADDAWIPANAAHSIQNVYASIEFAEEVTAPVWQRIKDIAAKTAPQLGLPRQSNVQGAMVKFSPGKPPESMSVDDERGVAFFRGTDGLPPQEQWIVNKNGIRYETSEYTRWAAFIDAFEGLVSEVATEFEKVVVPTNLSLEYNDLFLAPIDQPADASQVIDFESNNRFKDFDSADAWHCQTGWFEAVDAKSRRLVNVDVFVHDAQMLGDADPRRVIRIRTHESLRLSENAEPNQPIFSSTADVVSKLDNMHISLKRRLGLLLTENAKNMISLEDE